MNLSVVIPVHNGGENLRLCLQALAESVRPPDEVIVVDDASTDGSAGLGQTYGARVLRLPGPPRGAALPRNRGAAIASGDVLVFVDADVAVHEDALALMEQCLSTHGQVAAVFGSYDADPVAQGLVSRYKNLLHHYVHHHGDREASTFWTGCGAIRRDIFDAVGRFNESYRVIEDIELGARLRRAGHRIWLCPDVQVKHLKRWTFTSLLKSDIFDRAIPWSRLILRDRRLPAELNLDLRSRLSAFAVWVALVSLLLGLRWHWAWAGTLFGVAIVGALNADLYRFFWRQGGGWFAVGAASLHAFYLAYSSLIFLLVGGETLLSRLYASSMHERPGDRRQPHNSAVETSPTENQPQQESDTSE
ncbi:MAG: glycosyltransferase [Anaerolineae bacterium]|nr:glycosyltransferase [Anaerolineae bacterium]NIN96952.1 glycosyltransferase [Anaerolineae bacterium]NIQ79913.1 glycosyltransferase [Anaerolineae bacterium]